MTTFSYIVRTADKSQLDHFCLMQQVIDVSLDYQRKIPESDPDSVYTDWEFSAMVAFDEALGRAMSDFFHDVGPYWDVNTNLPGARIGDEWRCADCNVEGVITHEDPPDLCNSCASYRDWADGRDAWQETPHDEYVRRHNWLNRDTDGDPWVCTDLFEGYTGDDDIPF